MQLTNASQSHAINSIYLETTPAIYTVAPATQNQIDNLVSWVRGSSKVSYFDASVVLESAVISAAVKAGLLVETNGYLVLAQVEVEMQTAEAPATQPQDELDRQIAEGQQSIDPAYRLNSAMLQECTGVSFWDCLVREAEREMEITNLCEPILFDPELKLRQATENKQVFTGSYAVVKRNADVLAIGGSLLVRMRRHGSKGTWLLIAETLGESPHSQAQAA
ncbi:MAG: hypothetical protein FD167_1595 [bacterium]|nr:MAG: hypothetical protein FD167_1595 [bacterium]